MLRTGDKVKIFQTRENNKLRFMADGTIACIEEYSVEVLAELNGGNALWTCVDGLPSDDWSLRYNVALKVGE